MSVEENFVKKIDRQLLFLSNFLIFCIKSLKHKRIFKFRGKTKCIAPGRATLKSQEFKTYSVSIRFCDFFYFFSLFWKQMWCFGPSNRLKRTHCWRAIWFVRKPKVQSPLMLKLVDRFCLFGPLVHSKMSPSVKSRSFSSSVWSAQGLNIFVSKAFTFRDKY